VFAASIAILSLFFNSFFTLVFVLNTSLRQSPLYYFGILAVLDIIMAINYLLLMAVPVYMDQFEVGGYKGGAPWTVKIGLCGGIRNCFGRIQFLRGGISLSLGLKEGGVGQCGRS
jgi:hypothetical protein